MNTVQRHFLLLITSITLGGFCSGPLAGTYATGGSNYAWYKVEGASCIREPYGVIANFNTQSSVIKQQLAAMRANGQQRLRIPIFYGHNLNTGTVMNSTGGNLSAQNRKNLADFLKAVKNAGFVEIIVSFFPTGDYNDPAAWLSYKEENYQENWNVVFNVRPIIAASGMLYRIDLHNEAIPTSSQTALLQYTQHLWNDYVYSYGKNDTVGFSINTDTTQDRLDQLSIVYGDSIYGNHGAPYLFDLHIYGLEPKTQKNTFQIFQNAYNKIHPYFPGQGWIIGETSYNDFEEAQDLNLAITATGQIVFYVAQWPLTTSTFAQQPPTNCRDVELIPTSYDNYLSSGL